MEPTDQGEVSKLSQVIQIDEGKIQEHLGEVVRSTVEETLNAMLDAEADRLCGAERYERTEARQDTRAGSYQRHLQTKAGEVTLKVPKLRTLPFETAIIERYRRRESSVEEALVEMYLAGVSVRRVEDITEALWGTRVSPSTVSELNQKIYGQIENWRNRPIEGKHPYVFLDGLWLKRSWGGEVRNVSAAMHGAFLSQRVHGGTDKQGQGSGGHAESDSRARRSDRGTPEGGASLSEVKGDEAGGCGRPGDLRNRRNAVLLRLPSRALALSADQQPTGADSA